MKFNMLNLILKDNIWFQLDVIEHYVFGLNSVEFYFVFLSFFDKNIYKHLFEIFFFRNLFIELKTNDFFFLI
jgi:hypothetical protein